MKTKIVQIGNSKGVRIPKALLEQVGLKGTIIIEVEGNRLILRASKEARAGWEKAFRRMSERGDDALVFPDAHVLSGWDRTEWTW